MTFAPEKSSGSPDDKNRLRIQAPQWARDLESDPEADKDSLRKDTRLLLIFTLLIGAYLFSLLALGLTFSV